MIRVFDAFSGIGGFRSAFERVVGFKMVGWGYVYGTYGNILTEELLQDRADLFGEQVTGFEDFIRENWMQRRTADCVGLIKGYGWYNPDSGEIVVGTNGMAGEKRLDEIMAVIEKHLGIN